MTDTENQRVTNRKTDFEEIDRLGPDKSKYWQVDLIKACAIVLVIMDHSIPSDIRFSWGSPFWQRIAIPLFLIVLGFNWAKSMEKYKNSPILKLYSWNSYFKKKLLRFFLPFAIIYVLSLILYFLVIRPNPYFVMDVIYYDDPMLKLILFLPVWGPGNWFIPLLFITILIFPVIFKGFSNQPELSLVGCFAFEIGWYALILVVRMFWIDRSYEPIGIWNVYNTVTMIRCTPFRALSAIGLGVWLSQDHRWNSPRNILIWILGGLSAVYLYFYTFKEFSISFFSGDYNMLHFGWSALLVMLALNFLPKEPTGGGYKFISQISKSTYHILMVQIFYFSIIYNLLLPFFGNPPDYSDPMWASIGGTNYWINYIWYYPFNLIVTFSLGILWNSLETKLLWERKTKLKKRQMQFAKKQGWVQ